MGTKVRAGIRSCLALVVLLTPSLIAAESAPTPSLAGTTSIGAPSATDKLEASRFADLPVCPLHPTQIEGFDSPEEADEAIQASENDQPGCRLDPRETTSTTELAPPPHTGYHHNGQQTSNYNFEGGRITAESQNVNNLAHDGSFDAFVVTRVLLKKSNGTDPCPDNPLVNDTRWVEIGTSEVSWDLSDRRRIYWYRATEDGECTWHFSTFSLAGGFFIFRVWNNSGLVDLEYWDTSCSCWALMDFDSKPDCATNACALENYNEVYTDGVSHPTWNDNIEVNSAKLFKSEAWNSWGTQYTTTVGDVSPYVRHVITNYVSYYVTS